MALKTTGIADPLHPLVGVASGFIESVNPTMRAIERVLIDIAATDIPVVLIGECGTGKDIVALRIHALSGCRNGTFVKLSCAAITTENFLATFSHDSAGNGNGGVPAHGTLFLDEICELELSCQPHLLHALPDSSAISRREEQGESQARVICATSRNLEEEMRAGRFREELYFRINGVCLRLPPLRHRKEDIHALLDYFVQRYATAFERPRPLLSTQAFQTLLAYSWPGNIRELENLARKLVVLGDERVALAELNSLIPNGRTTNGNGEGRSLKQASREASRQAEREMILKALARTRWNRKRAAQELQISYKALLYKLKQIGMDDSTTS